MTQSEAELVQDMLKLIEYLLREIQKVKEEIEAKYASLTKGVVSD